MALILCPECNGNVSDKAASCPHCGYHPICSPPAPRRGRPPKTTTTDMDFRLPNGYGTIKTLSGKRRRPYAAYVNPRLVLNEGKGTAYYAYDFLGSYSSKIDAYAAITQYNQNPTAIYKDITVKELFDKWCPSYIKENNYDDIMRKRYENQFSYCSPLYKVKVRDTSPALLKETIENASHLATRGPNQGKSVEASPIIKGNIKSLLNMLFDYAVFLRIVTENYARTFNIGVEETQKREGCPYSADEREILWKHSGSLFIDATLVQFYSGWRPGELFNIALENVDFQNLVFTGGIKTPAGIDRAIPIHTRILPIVEHYYKQALSIGRPVLFGRPAPFKGSYLYNDNSIRYSLIKELKALGITGHLPHDGRHTFSTLAKKAGMDDYARKKLMGHSIKDLTDKVYTHLDMEWFRQELEKIK